MTTTERIESPAERFAAMHPAERELLLGEMARKHKMTVPQLKAMLLREWRFLGRPKQQPPEGNWTFWMILAGRGFGKTLTGAQWARKKALGSKTRGAVIAPTLGDVRDICFEGETGLLTVFSNEQLMGGSRSHAWNRTLLELTLSNGTKIKGFGSEEPERLRGPQHHWVWGEEISSWKDVDKGDVRSTTFNNMKLGCRLGAYPQFCFTSTPKTNKLTKLLIELHTQGRLLLTRGSSYENRANLSEAWWQEVVAPLEGTLTGRQEIMAELIEDVEGALWTRTLIDSTRVHEAPPLGLVIVGVDPNESAEEGANAAGVIVAGKDVSTQHGYVLADRSTTRGGPAAWSQAAVDAYHEFEADMIVAEANAGGEMVRLTIHGVDPNVPVKLVHASRGKRTRAEPVAILYHQKATIPATVHHVGSLPDLENEMVTWVPGQKSPDRMDAAVWACTELMLGSSGPIAMTTHVPEGRIDGGTHTSGAGGLVGLDGFGV